MDRADFGVLAGVDRSSARQLAGAAHRRLFRRLVTMRLDYPDGALDVDRWGLRLRLQPRDNGCEKKLLFTPQMYERVERAELAAEIARARAEGSAFVFIDVGANVGLFSLFVAACARCQARILAVEPEPENLARLRFNIRINSNLPIRVIPVALADRAGELAIQVDRRDSGTRVQKIAGGENPSSRRGRCCRYLPRNRSMPSTLSRSMWRARKIRFWSPFFETPRSLFGLASF